MPARLLLTLFVLRILVLIISSYLNRYYFPVSDSVVLNKFGIEEYHLLFQNPHEYFLNIFQSNSPEAYSRLLDDSHSYWNNLRTNLLIKMMSIFDLLSFGDFLINTLFYNFLVFFGFIALFRVFIKIFPKCYYLLLTCIFIFPSALFFTSMINRDGLILLSLSMIIYHIFFIISDRFSLKRTAIIVFFLLVIFLLRNFVFITLIPALIAWLIANKFPKYAFLSFVVVYAFTTVLFFSSSYISPRANLPQYVSSRQKSFIHIGEEGNSTISIKPLYPNLKSFISNAPQAFNHALMRPYLSEATRIEYVPFALEVFIIELIFVVFLFYHKKNILVNPLIYFFVFLSFTMLLITGYTVPIIGAIVRYRSIYFIFLTIPILCYTDWQKVKNTIFSKRNTAI
ncbi:MAG: hypothetical protein ABI184_06520 [Ginsengibacter sp.]